MNLANLLGVDASELLKARGTAENMARDLRRLVDSMQAQVGAVPAEAVPHSRARTPYMRTIQLTASGMATTPILADDGSLDFGAVAPARARVDLEVTLGRPATRGHVRNIGAHPLLVRFRGPADDWSAYYELQSGQELDHSAWMVSALEVATLGPLDARAQVLAQ